MAQSDTPTDRTPQTVSADALTIAAAQIAAGMLIRNGNDNRPSINDTIDSAVSVAVDIAARVRELA